MGEWVMYKTTFSLQCFQPGVHCTRMCWCLLKDDGVGVSVCSSAFAFGPFCLTHCHTTVAVAVAVSGYSHSHTQPQTSYIRHLLAWKSSSRGCGQGSQRNTLMTTDTGCGHKCWPRSASAVAVRFSWVR